MNKKGLTIVELIVSFVLISIVFIGIMTIIFTYRSIVTDSNYKTQLYQFKNNLTKDIYADMLQKKVSSVSKEGSKVKITFGDGNSYKYLEIDQRDLRNKKIIYGNRIYKLEDSIPDIKKVDSNGNQVSETDLTNYQNIVVGKDITLEEENGIFKIRIDIKYKDLTDDYSINIVYKTS